MISRAKYGYVWVTSAFFALSLLGHWLFGWLAYTNEQADLGLPIQFGEYAIEMSRDMFENWQSEFLQLIWQVAGLALLLYVGSPQSKDGDERKEEKIDAILHAVNLKKLSRLSKHEHPKSEILSLF